MGGEIGEVWYLWELKKFVFMDVQPKPAPNISPSLFWDTSFAQINWERNAPYVIERVMSRGDWDDFKKLLSFYGKLRVKNEVLKLRYLDDRTLAFCAAFFNLPIEKFRCYSFKQLNQGHWNY